MAEQYLQLRRKLFRYRIDRSSEQLQINLCIEQNKKIKITLCFPSEDWYIVSEERERIEDLFENDISPDEWYLVPNYDIVGVNTHYFRFKSIVQFILIRN